MKTICFDNWIDFKIYQNSENDKLSINQFNKNSYIISSFFDLIKVKKIKLKSIIILNKLILLVSLNNELFSKIWKSSYLSSKKITKLFSSVKSFFSSEVIAIQFYTNLNKREVIRFQKIYCTLKSFSILQAIKIQDLVLFKDNNSDFEFKIIENTKGQYRFFFNRPYLINECFSRDFISCIFTKVTYCFDLRILNIKKTLYSINCLFLNYITLVNKRALSLVLGHFRERSSLYKNTINSNPYLEIVRNKPKDSIDLYNSEIVLVPDLDISRLLFLEHPLVLYESIKILSCNNYLVA